MKMLEIEFTKDCNFEGLFNKIHDFYEKNLHKHLHLAYIIQETDRILIIVTTLPKLKITKEQETKVRSFELNNLKKVISEKWNLKNQEN